MLHRHSTLAFRRFRWFFVMVLMLAMVSTSVSSSHRTALAGDGGGSNAKRPPQQPLSCPIGFFDVRPSDYFYEGVRYLYCMGAIIGYGDGSFRPGNLTTRGQISKIVVLAENLPVNTSGGPHFHDVPASDAFYTYVETAYNRGIISGYGDGTFRSNAYVTRGQIAKIIVTTKGWPLANPSAATFHDVPAGSTYFTHVETAASRGVVSGYGNGSFRPGDSATRGQVSKMLYIASAALTPFEAQTIAIINQRRAALGRGPLQINPQLSAAARRHSVDIGPAGLCQHNGRDGTSPWDRIAQSGYEGSAMGEVVGCGYFSPQNVVDGWWNSPGHYAVLTDPNANDIGCGWWLMSTGAGWQTCDTGRTDRP